MAPASRRSLMVLGLPVLALTAAGPATAQAPIRIVTAYPWYEIDAPAHERFVEHAGTTRTPIGPIAHGASD